MLTADLVDARRKGNELLLRPLEPAARDEALAVADALLEAARAHVGRRREDLEAAWTEIENGARHGKLAAGLVKLTLDGCTFEADDDVDAVAVRKLVFERAQASRLALAPGEPFDRTAVLEAAAAELGHAPAAVERMLFADLKGEHALVDASSASPRALVEAWELGQAQAVLLRATRVTCVIEGASPGPLRAFFAKLKFRRLLFAAERLGDRAFRVVVDGPASMFEAGTRYGVGLATLLPALRELEAWTLEADVRWGKERAALTFKLASDADGQTAGAGQGPPSRDVPATHLSEETAALLDELRKKPGPYAVSPADGTLLDVPGLGVCVPDLVVKRAGYAQVFVEVLGFWSRDAVFKRVELAAKGLGARIVFVASAKLRVSEALLDAQDDAALYVHKGKPRAAEVLARVERLMGEPLPAAPKKAAAATSAAARPKGRR